MRFSGRTNEVWALVPGPEELAGSVNGDSVREVADYAATEIADHARRFTELVVVRDAEPDHEYWKAEITNEHGKLSLRMTLHDETTFGGFGVSGDCERELLLDFWSHLQSKFPAIWLFAPDLRLYSPEAAMAGPIA